MIDALLSSPCEMKVLLVVTLIFLGLMIASFDKEPLLNYVVQGWFKTTVCLTIQVVICDLIRAD
jgi:TM2 domain-containing membrane protein YozV